MDGPQYRARRSLSDLRLTSQISPTFIISQGAAGKKVALGADCQE
jgi:hypothetical protein